jgi:sec-independent protein translocase protein TatC
MSYRDTNDYSEDMFADTRMSFGEHIEELRIHMIRALAGFGIALFFSLFIGHTVLGWIKAPVEKQLKNFYDDRANRALERLKKGDPHLAKLNEPIEIKITFDRGEVVRQLLPPDLGEKALDKAQGDRVEVTARIEEPFLQIPHLQNLLQEVGHHHGLIVLSLTEGFMAYVKVCLLCGLVLGSPWIFYQLWAFVAAGLYPHEKRYVNVYLPFSVGLFLAGILMCQFLVMPKAIEALLWFNHWVGLDPQLRFNEWLGFAIMLPLVTGLSFQLPLVMMFLERVGVFTVESYRSRWKMALMVIHLVAALGPSIDPISMELIALPVFGLYWLGIFLCRFNPREPDLDVDVPDPEEMVEV